MDIGNVIEKQNYQQHVNKTMPKSRFFKELVMAFLVGGLICVLGEALNDFGEKVLLLEKEGVGTFRSAVLIFLGALFTGIGVYDVLGRVAGAGSIVPITGFANSIVSPALEYKWEGYVMGVGAKLFTIAGPVLVYGISTSVVAGLLYYIFGGVL
jgi:stage V sporulation protein AC